MNDSGSFPLAIGDDIITIPSAMLERYSRPGPRYTSYPTAPEWSGELAPEDFREALAARHRRPLSLYMHLPFCRSLCLFCGCNVVISRDPEISRPYLNRLKREIDMTAAMLGEERNVEQLHWGGGTPTFLEPGQIAGLFDHLAGKFSFPATAELGIEIEPRVTTGEQCRLLRDLGFNRISMGVQDFDPLVQRTVRRIQPYEMTRTIYDLCRDLGFESINLDLIYGLPHQSAGSFRDTVEKVIAMNPDRIALFSYAHVPWLKKQQGSFERHLPSPAEKFRIFAMAIAMLTDAGYRYIGMDHFVRPDDELCRAQDSRTLHRNFQGYTTRGGCDLIGFGASAISMLDEFYAQNQRELPRYNETIDAGGSPMMRGVRVSAEDRLRRDVINRILCHCMVVKSEVEGLYGIDFDRHFAGALEELQPLEEDRLVLLHDDRIEVTPLGRIFIRNIAMPFDAYLKKAPGEEGKRMFSSTL